MKNIQYITISVFITAYCVAQNKISYPVTDKSNQIDNYFGTNIEDTYRWLEDDRSEKTEKWVSNQNEVTENYFNSIQNRSKIKNRLTELWNFNKESAPFKKGNYFFCYKNNGLQNQNVLYIKNNLTEEGEVLLDPNTLSNDGTISLSTIAFSKDATLLAYGLSKAGSDWIEIHFKNVITKEDLPDVIKWVKFSSISWKGNGIFYSRYDEPKERVFVQKNQFHKVYFHHLGSNQERDSLVFNDLSNPDYNFSANVTDDENYLIISASESTSGNKLMIKDLRNPNSEFITIANNFDFENDIVENIGNTFYMLTNNNAPKYKLISFIINERNDLKWKTILPESINLLESVRFCNHKIIATYLNNACSKLNCYNLNGALENVIELPGVCKINSFSSNNNDDFATYSIVQYSAPEQTYYLDAKTWQSKLMFKPNCNFDSQNYTTKQVFYKSKDGTNISMFITHKKNLVINSTTPCFVFGYGGFNISMSPEFRIDRAVFLEAGGIYCVPNLRGGGEYGEEWHKAGTKCNKQNVFDDFISACDYLVKNKYTSYQKIAIHGRSNGGLLIGAVLTQRPDICKVALPTVGVLDMLRFHLFTIGRAWTVDYGCSENQNDFNCLIKYSPLHNIKSINYPATLILTGDHDDRVVPAHSFKFAATLQEKNTSTYPTLIRVDVNAGHGAGKPVSKQINEFGDMWSFVFQNLEMNY
jgi:prolyl oligopeptidase